jgi:hypothetical protein
MDTKIINEIKRNLRLMNINESKIILNEANLGPELEAILRKLTPEAGNAILGKLKLTFPTEAVLNSADKALTKIVKFIGTDLTKLESVLEIAIAENIITKQTLVGILEKELPDVGTEITRLARNGADIQFLKQKFGANELKGFPPSVQDEYLAKLTNGVEGTNSLGAPKPNTTIKNLKTKMGDAEEIFSDTRNNMTKLPDGSTIGGKFKAYEQIVERLPNLDGESKILMKLGFEDAANKSISEIITEGSLIVKNLNDAKYGWLKRLFMSSTKNPTKTISTGGKSILLIIFYYVLVMAALAGAAWVFYFKQKYMPAPPESNTTNNSETNSGSQSSSGGSGAIKVGSGN